MSIKKLPILFLLLVASGISGQTQDFLIGQWVAYPHFEIYGMGFNNANNTVTCITDRGAELYHFKEGGTLTVSGRQFTMGPLMDDEKETAEITDITSGVQCRWTLDVTRQCISLEWANNRSSLLIYSRIGPDTLLVAMQDIQANGLPAPQFKVLVFKRH